MNNIKMNKKLTIGIPARNRGIEISLLMYSLLNQTFQDYDIIIYNDFTSNFLFDNSTFQGILKLHKNLNHNIKIIEGKRLGPQFGGESILRNSKTKLIFRCDDDVTLLDNCLEKLIEPFDDTNVFATGPIYLSPYNDISDQTINIDEHPDYLEYGKINLIDDKIYVNGILNSSIPINLKEKYISVQHLHSGFMYRKSELENIGGYYLQYSKVGFREESDVSYRLFLNNGKLLICPDALAFHFHPISGGIYIDDNGQLNKKDLWEHDEKLFIERFRNGFKDKVKLQTNNDYSLDDYYKEKKIKELFPICKESSESSISNKRPPINIITITHGNHENLQKLILSIMSYTKESFYWTIINNDPSDESIQKFDFLMENFRNEHELFFDKNINYKNLDKEVSVSEARNIGAKIRHKDSKYICFVDDDALILGKWSEKDWLDIMYEKINEESNIGAVSPIYTWFEPLKSNVLSVACLLISVKIWEQIGGFDPIFGNKEKETWGHEDSDWSYRLQMAGYKIKGIEHSGFPFYHEDTTFKKKEKWQEEGLIKAKELLLSKHSESTHIVILTYGEHLKLKLLLEDIVKYTETKYSICVINNDSSEESHDKLNDIMSNLFPDSEFILNYNLGRINYENLRKEKTLGEARNLGVKLSPSSTKYICFIDDDSRILGKFSDIDWLEQMINMFNSELDTGSISPYYVWYNPLRSFVSTTGCLLTSINIWNQIGGFDPIFGKNDSWGKEDVDWSYRLQMAGYKIKQIGPENFPYYHPHDDPNDIDPLTNNKKRPENRIEKIKKSEELLLLKYNIKEIQKYNRTVYPFTKEQMECRGKKLNIGCYYMKLSNFINIDFNSECDPDIVGDIRELEFDDESIDLILASQVIEHFDLVDVKCLFSKFYEWLKPGGHLIIEVPDVGKILDMVEKDECKLEDYYFAIYGIDKVIGMKHRSQFDEKLLIGMLKEEGFNNIIRNCETSDNDEITLRFDIKK